MAPDPTKRIQDFKKKEKDNGKCAVCGGFSDTILMQHHSFVCSRCSGVLREVGLTVKGIAATNWTAADADKICNGGNRRERDELCGGWDGSELAVNPDSSDRDVKKFIQAKYVDRKWATGGGSKPSSGGGGGGGGGGGQSSSSRQPDAGEAKKFAGMFGDLTEEKAAELLKKYGSIEEALEPYLASLGSEPEPTPAHTSSKSGAKKKEEKEKKKKHHHHKSHEEDSMTASFGSFNSTPTPAMSSFSNPDVQPPSLGQASPDRIEGMAGVMGMMYRGEMDNSQMGSAWGGGGGGNVSAGQFSSVPGNFGSEQQQQQNWQQPATSSTWGGQSMPNASSFNSVPSNMGGQQPGSQNTWGQPQNSWQAPGSQSQPASQSSWQGAPGSQSQPAANPFQQSGQGQGWNSQQQNSDQQAKLQQLLKLRERKQEILRNLQQAQAAAAAGGGGCGQPPNSNFGTGGQMPCSGYGGQAPSSGFNMGGQMPSSGCGGPCGFPQAPYSQSSQPCFGGPQANMYSSPAFGQVAYTQNAF
eukprot:TRINITY_DN20549_c0_g1_i1.p1 TRINITY_DN20549_c0_g1~~TRINITY_DN20549_c0_g1_i1.p1  ORF type:complete len:526 (+),score=120.97 TRINITY_DN20549_c0_g1_i1:40-1617(+)